MTGEVTHLLHVMSLAACGHITLYAYLLLLTSELEHENIRKSNDENNKH